MRNEEEQTVNFTNHNIVIATSNVRAHLCENLSALCHILQSKQGRYWKNKPLFPENKGDIEENKPLFLENKGDIGENKPELQ